MNLGKGHIIAIGALALVMAVVFVFALAWVGRCDGRGGYAADSVLAAGLATAVANDAVVAFRDMKAFQQFKWDRVFFFEPYTPRKVVEQRLGASPGFRWSSMIDVTEGYTLVVFKEKKRVVRFFDFPASSGDFSQAAEFDAGFSDQEAVFHVVPGPQGAWVMIPVPERSNEPVQPGPDPVAPRGDARATPSGPRG